MSPLISDSPETDAMTLNPSTPSAKYDAGVKARATVDSGSVSRTSTSRPNKPPTRPGVQRDAQRFARFALLLHRVAVDDRGGRSVGAGRADQNGRNRAPVFRADIGGSEQHDGDGRIHAVREGQQQRHRDRRGNARQRAAQNAPRDAGERSRSNRRGDNAHEGVDHSSDGESPGGCAMRMSRTNNTQQKTAPAHGNNAVWRFESAALVAGGGEDQPSEREQVTEPRHDRDIQRCRWPACPAARDVPGMFSVSLSPIGVSRTSAGRRPSNDARSRSKRSAPSRSA